MIVSLKDDTDIGKYLELSFVYHDRDEDEGSQLIARFYIDNRLEIELKFRWTNLVLKLFIDMLKQFPIERYDGVFSHFEKHFEMYWENQASTDLYHLTFDLLTRDDEQFEINVRKERIQDFGLALEHAMQIAPCL